MNDNREKHLMIDGVDVEIGPFTYGEQNITIKQWGENSGLRIGSFCSMAQNLTVFLGGNHRHDWCSTYPFGHVFQDQLGAEPVSGHPATNGDVVVGNDVWIGHGVTIMSGVNIGDGAVIGANAHVVKDVAPYTVVGGNPARLIKSRFDAEIVELLLTLRWWSLPPEKIRSIRHILQSTPDADALRAMIANLRATRNS